MCRAENPLEDVIAGLRGNYSEVNEMLTVNERVWAFSKELKLSREQPVTGPSWRANRESVVQSSRFPYRDTLDGHGRATQRPRDKDGPLPEILRFEHPQRAGVSDPDRR